MIRVRLPVMKKPQKLPRREPASMTLDDDTLRNVRGGGNGGRVVMDANMMPS